MNTPKVQSLRYVSASALVKDFSLGLWDDNPFSVGGCEIIGSSTLQMVDICSFQSWANEVLDLWEDEGPDISEARESFNKVCEGLAKDDTHVELDYLREIL
jgi:hypothetical protein